VNEIAAYLHKIDYPSRTPDQWEAEMARYPCYTPAMPFYDFCLNADQPVKRYDCGLCMERHGLWDTIE